MAEREDVPLCPDCSLAFCDFIKKFYKDNTATISFLRILGKGGCGEQSPHLRRGLGGEAPSLGYILLCLDKVRKVRLG